MELIASNKKNDTQLSSSERSNSLLIHLSALSSLFIPFGSIILPIILWQTMKKESSFVDQHGKEAVNFNLSFLLYFTLSILLLFGSLFGSILTGVNAEQSSDPDAIAAVLFSSGGFVVAILLIIILSVIKLILMIIAAIKANDGNHNKYPMIIRFIS